MPRYRITISGQTPEAMADLVQRHKIRVFDHGVRRQAGGYVVQAIADDEQIRFLEANGYHIARHEDVDEEGQKRQSEVSRENRYQQRDPR